MDRSNLQRVDIGMSPDGKTVAIPVPFDCPCGQPAQYGLNDRWRCTTCWQREFPTRTAI